MAHLTSFDLWLVAGMLALAMWVGIFLVAFYRLVVVPAGADHAGVNTGREAGMFAALVFAVLVVGGVFVYVALPAGFFQALANGFDGATKVLLGSPPSAAFAG